MTVMHVAFFLGSFPIISETFIMRQMTYLIDQGHELSIYADYRPWDGSPQHPQVREYRLLSRTTYMDMPEAVQMEMPVWPLTGTTWLPGAITPIRNVHRALRAVPILLRTVVAAPLLTMDAFKASKYHYEARSLSSLYRLARLSTVTKRPDIVHAQFGTTGNSFKFVRHLWNVPLVVSFRGHDYSRWPKEHGLKVYDDLFRIADAITINTEFSRQRVEMLGCPPGKIYKIPSSLSLDEYPFAERTYNGDGSIRILTVGRLVEMKGVEFSIRAIAKLVDQYPSIKYDIIGDGPLMHNLRDLANEMAVEKYVTFHGSRDESFVRQLMQSAHILILPSVTTLSGEEESLGNVLTEAQASGIPVVATQHNGFPETIVPNRSGYLVPERDVDALAERLEYLILHPDLWPALGRCGRTHVEQNYDILHVGRRLVELYTKLLKPH